MKYHFYFHNDFDGVVSAAAMLNFLRSRGDEAASFNPIDYVPGLKEKWPDFKFKQPSVMVDFLYHPDLTWWFDHHPTSFINKKWREEYQNDETHYFNAKHKSCAGAVSHHFKKILKYKFPEFISYLVKWADIIDYADFVSARQAIYSRAAAMKLAFLIDNIDVNNEQNIQTYGYLISELANKPVFSVVNQPSLRGGIEKIYRERKKAAKYFGDISRVIGDVIVIDRTQTKTYPPRFLGYFLYPKIKYSISVGFDKEPSAYKISVGKNPWLEFNSADIGKLMAKYGGGGHKDVGGYEHKSKKQIFKIAEEIIKYLNDHG